MLKLRHLKINKYRNVRPGSELTFSDGHNILLGRNGTGKTTLLNLLSNLLRLPLDELCTEEMDIELELSFPGGRVTATVKATAEPSQLATMGGRFAPDLTIGVGGTIFLDGHEPRQMIERETIIDMIQGGAMIQGGVAKVPFKLGNLLRFDESLQVLEAHYKRSPLLILRVQLWGQFVRSPGHLSDDVTEILRRRFDEDPQIAELRIGHEDLPALREVARILEFRGAELRVSLLEKEVKSRSLTEYSFGNPRYLFTKRNGSIIPLDHLSYGQKRLLAFYLYLGANSDIVIADELVNGLHHQWIEECIQAIGDRQTFLTSQNPLLMDYLGFASAEEVQRTFVMCRQAQVDDEDELLWGNMSTEEAEMFFSAYQVGLQQVGEILRTRGLW